MRKFIGLKTACATLALVAATAIALPAQTFSFNSFDGTNGANPYASLVQATDGNLYGITYADGAYGGGTVFKISPSLVITKIHDFCSQSGCTDGSGPYLEALVQATDGNFYGTTVAGGANESCSFYGAAGCGTVFKVAPNGTFTTLYSFCSQTGCTDGQQPYAGLIQATDGNFYGTTESGGANGFGTIFKMTPGGTLTTLYTFCSQSGCADGTNSFAPLLQATDGNFYGTTYGGGANGDGTVFKMTPGGTLTTLHSFDFTDGDRPAARLIQATDGNFYGTANFGGAFGQGTAFKITPSGTLTKLCDFAGFSQAGLIQGTDGNFYGTTVYGGNSYGSVYEMSPSGTVTQLHVFEGYDGGTIYAPLVQDTNGTFYGTGLDGGANNDGVVFSVSVGLAPFVETQPTLGQVGRLVKILGTNLTGATSVTFNGTPAVFKVISNSLIGATVPVGATSGKVQVVTPSGTLSSNVPFRVRQ